MLLLEKITSGSSIFGLLMAMDQQMWWKKVFLSVRSNYRSTKSAASSLIWCWTWLSCLSLKLWSMSSLWGSRHSWKMAAMRAEVLPSQDRQTIDSWKSAEGAAHQFEWCDTFKSDSNRRVQSLSQSESQSLCHWDFQGKTNSGRGATPTPFRWDAQALRVPGRHNGLGWQQPRHQSTTAAQLSASPHKSPESRCPTLVQLSSVCHRAFTLHREHVTLMCSICWTHILGGQKSTCPRRRQTNGDVGPFVCHLSFIDKSFSST